MIDENSMDRIIGDFFEINASILVKREKSKLPKFISKYIWKKNKNDILKNIEMLRNSDYILTYTNLTELFLYVFNNFDDKRYKSIQLVKMNKLINQSIIEVVVEFDNIKALLEFPQDSTSFELKIIEKDKVGQIKSFNHTLNKLNVVAKGITSDKDTPVSRLNKELKNILCDYIYDSISLYE